MYDIITIGTASLDIVVKSDDFILAPQKEGGVALCETLGAKLDVSELKMISGGGATNVAVGCSRLGLHCAVVCEVGQDFPAQMIFDDLRKDNVDSQFVVSERLEETAVSVLLVAKTGGRTIMTHRGAAYQLESRDIPWEDLRSTRWLHLGSLAGDIQLIQDMLEFMSAHEVGSSWTPSSTDLKVLESGKIDTTLLTFDVIAMNKQEWESIPTVQPFLLKNVPTIVITDGANGGVVFTQGVETQSFTAKTVDVIEETGAGDAFMAGFLSAMIKGKTLAECVEWGKENASSVIQYLGAKEGLLTLRDMSNF